MITMIPLLSELKKKHPYDGNKKYFIHLMLQNKCSKIVFVYLRKKYNRTACLKFIFLTKAMNIIKKTDKYENALLIVI